MTEAAFEAQINSLLASGQPITAAIHRNMEGVVKSELYNAASRGAVLAGVTTQPSLSTGDEVFIVRAGLVYRVNRDVFAGVNGGTP